MASDKKRSFNGIIYYWTRVLQSMADVEETEEVSKEKE